MAESFTFKEEKLMQSTEYEHISDDVCVGKKIFLLFINCFYRPPHYENHYEFLEESEIILNNLSTHKADVKIIASYLNFGNVYCKHPILRPKPLDASAPAIYANYGFDQLIEIPTQVTDKTISLIYLIFKLRQQSFYK